MEYTIKNLSKSEIEITVKVPEEKMHEYRKKASEELSKDVKIKGFRPGHIPPKVLEDTLGKKQIDLHANEIAIQSTYSEIVIKDKLQVLTRPTINIESLEPLTYKATVAVMPEIEIKDYKSIKIKQEEVKVTKDDLDKVMEDMKKHGTTYNDVDRAAKNADRVEVDFEGFDQEGKAVPNTKSENHPVILGGESLIPGFEDQIVGMKKDEKKEFDIDFPKDYHKKNFQNKKMKFKVELKRIEEPKEGELNEELIEKMTGQKHTVEEFKKNLEKNILARKTQELQQKRENEYIEKLLKQIKVELPASLVDEEAEHILLEMKEDIEAKGLEFTQFLERSKTTEEKLKEKYKEEAERRIKIRLAIGHIIKEEKVEITDKEVASELEKVKSYYPEDQQDKIQQDFDTGNLGTSLRNRMLIRKLFDKVLA